MEEKMVTLKERAIQAAKERQERREIEKIKAMDKFAQTAIKEFQDRFGTDIEKLSVKGVNRNAAEIMADGLKFDARRIHREYDTYIRFYLRAKCEKCGRWFTHPTPCENLADVGQLLINPAICDSCRYNIDTETTKSEAEQVMEMLRKIIEICKKN